ncbi:hypothetical protein Tco_1280070 [Tanacetum coccineum]
MTLAQALEELKSAKPKADKLLAQDPEQKGLLFMNSSKHLHQQFLHNNHHRLDEELAFKIQAEEEKEERLAREKAQQIEEANITWDDQDELTDEEKARLFVQFLEQRRKHFAAKRVEEKRNKPPTRAQQRSIMCIYLKNMDGWKPKSLKNKSFANIKELFAKAMKRVNTFVDYITELVEEREELEQESSKKQKLEEDKESEELKQCLEIIPDDGDDVTIDAIPLSTKSQKEATYQVVIGKCNMRIKPTKTQKEATYQVVLETLKLSPCYKAFLITMDVPEIYMHQFWFTISKIKDTSSNQFNLDKKKFRIGVEVFHEIL